VRLVVIVVTVSFGEIIGVAALAGLGTGGVIRAACPVCCCQPPFLSQVSKRSKMLSVGWR
tara:strand:- start:124 stop:303 length:180 start_codon:yes stop_codon:yes gene_type:complete